jgi:ankyrin repeat protein
MIEHLLKAGADVNEHGPNGETPLMFAARNGRVDAIRVLLDHKAEVNVREKLRGTTALMGRRAIAPRRCQTIANAHRTQILAVLISERDKLNRAIEALGGTTGKRLGRPPGTETRLHQPNILSLRSQSES